MVAILKHVGTTDRDRVRLNMSINTPARWSVRALKDTARDAISASSKSATEKERGGTWPANQDRNGGWHFIILKAGNDGV